MLLEALSVAKRVITIEIDDNNMCDVREGDRFCDRLAWDEMIGAIVELTHRRLGPGHVRYGMLTREQHDERERALKERYAAMRQQGESAE